MTHDKAERLNAELTHEELEVVMRLAEAYAAFIKLPVQHPMHQQEFTMAVHQAQQLVMSRPAARAMGWVKDELPQPTPPPQPPGWTVR